MISQYERYANKTVVKTVGKDKVAFKISQYGPKHLNKHYGPPLQCMPWEKCHTLKYNYKEYCIDMQVDSYSESDDLEKMIKDRYHIDDSDFDAHDKTLCSC